MRGKANENYEAGVIDGYDEAIDAVKDNMEDNNEPL